MGSPELEVEQGMESSRGGPLTTFIMTLPMIVVPAIAMLKPADNGKSLLSGLLQAASDQTTQSEPADGTELGDFAAVEDDFDSMFADFPGDAPAFTDSTDGAAVPADNAFPFFDSTTGDTSVFTDGDGGNDTQLLAKLSQLGATRTLWFSPGPQQTGFVAFFPSPQGQVSYRFEGIAASKTAAIQQVIQQAEAWRLQQ